MIAIVDYGMGNLGSIQNMLKRIGAASVITSDPAEIERAEKLILPGVGAFDAAMQRLGGSRLKEVLDERVLGYGVPILGICLGMQLLTESSEEGKLPGFGWIKAKTLAFRGRIDGGLKVPHMGWNHVRCHTESPLTAGFDKLDEIRYYFVHSFFVHCEDERDAILTTEYGLIFHSGVQRGNILGVQFHPEKSHRFGMKLLENFVRL